MKYNDLEPYTKMYKATKSGNIYSLYSNKILSEYTTAEGYKTVSLYHHETKKRLTVFVHRFVAYCLVPGFGEGLQVNHIDGIKSNNEPSNLEWVTAQENTYHASRIIKSRDYRGKGNPRYGVKVSEKTRKQISESLKNNDSIESAVAIPVVGTHVKTGKRVKFSSALEASRELGICNSLIRKVIKGKGRTAGGYRWEDYSK